MKKIYMYMVLGVTMLLAGCDLDRYPETTLSDKDFWKTESDLKFATNRLYNLLGGFWVDTRADDLFGSPNSISNGSRDIPNTSGDWTDPYYRIQTANIILKNSADMEIAEDIKNRYQAEACFFRAYYYFELVKKYGDVPLVLKAFDDNNDPDLFIPRSPRADVLKQVYDDLDFCATWLPTRANLSKTDWGRVTRSAALALKARIGLYEGTRSKFHSYGTPNEHLDIAVKACELVMKEGHELYSDYAELFQYDAEGPGNKENILVKVYGKTGSGENIQTHNNSRDLENRYAPTRNLLDLYLCSDGLPYGVSPLVSTDETSYNEVLDNRDPRVGMTFYRVGEQGYKGVFQAYGFGKTAYSMKKGYIQQDWDSNGGAIVDKMLIRYAEVLLTYAEAKFELNNGTISDTDLNNTINKLRDRVGFNIHLTNGFVAANNLDMREEIRRERSVELAGEGFRYDDIIRWKTAEVVLKKTIMGARFTANGDWGQTQPETLLLDSDNRLIIEKASDRRFDPNKDYLYPVPLNEISLSRNNVTQNPNWTTKTN